MAMVFRMDLRRFRKNLLTWYAENHRRLPWRETADPYAIWVSEIMLQQTRVETAIGYYRRFMARFPTPARLAEADVQTVLKMWEGLGYYTRARNLHRAAKIVAAQWNGRVPDDPDLFRTLPGVGSYTRAAVMSIAYGKALAVVDGNVKRVVARLMEVDAPVNRPTAHRIFEKPASRLLCPKEPATFNQAIMELGALICRPKDPQCAACPVSDFCLAYRHKTTLAYPKRDPAKAIPHRHVLIFVICKRDNLLVVQRPLEGFLGGLWEFPAIPGPKKRARLQGVVTAFKQETGLTIDISGKLTRIKHAYTHFSLSGDVYLGRYQKGRVRLRSAAAHRWVTPGALQRLALHKANHKVLETLTTSLPHRFCIQSGIPGPPP